MPNMHKVNDKLQAALDDDDKVPRLQAISEEVFELVLEAAILVDLEDELEAGAFAGVLFALGAPDPDEQPAEAS